ncbi:bifunctional [glutamine synthetase] adenylyltransferase/[glutamine synthetase]-adenylyl-L-tyrosine phosphorylase [Micrococcales bacterium 31B]|nr:bifunctional [glutamine synthetase] adenylyltransferase/[glutamine synthetase]-adenylyl-L-tyrosine phosphorylase [Micrococcales bacterium 31B]
MPPVSETQLARFGFVDAARAARFLASPEFSAQDDTLAEDLGRTADPDLALLALLRILETALTTAEAPLWLRVVGERGELRQRVLSVLGASESLGDHMVRHTDYITWLDPALDAETGYGLDLSAEDLRTRMLRHVGADPEAAMPVAASWDGVLDAFRMAYRVRLLQIAAADTATADPTTVLTEVARAHADLAASSLEAALAIARGEIEGHDAVRLTVLGMGKCGGRELNYISDVDVIYIAEPAREGVPDDTVTQIGSQLATRLALVCSKHTSEGSLWQVDPNLRPEGKDGPLVRTVASHLAYYQRWASTWEFQALLKARWVAGDRELADQYLAAMHPMVWEASRRESFVPDTQAMRKRVERNIPAKEVERQIKLGPGGLRDVEFTVQLLQMVHGRADDTIRSSTTLTALGQLAAGGYVGRDIAEKMDAHYRFLRSVEHRIQVFRMRREHVLPTGAADIRRIARGMGMLPDEFNQRFKRVRTEVRQLHEELFYRPLLPVAAQLSRDDAVLSPEAARERLAAIGYADPAGAVRHIEALTAGVSRRAAIQRQLLPVLLSWFAEGTDPDMGLLSFRRISDELGGTHWYLRMLRDSSGAAQRLAQLVSSSRYVTELLEREPEAVAWLGSDEQMRPLSRDDLWSQIDARLTRASDESAAVEVLRGLRRRELLHVAMGDVTGMIDSREVGATLTDLTVVCLRGALRVARHIVAEETGFECDFPMIIVGQGSFGAYEMGYTSDADVQFVVGDVPGNPLVDQLANQVAAVVRRLMGGPGPEPKLEVSADLRPEGRNAPLVRSLALYREYYAKWAHLWERQALTRATVFAGSGELTEQFTQFMEPLRYPEGGLSAAEVKEIRRMKARVEAERLPRGADRKSHIKLGQGGLTDVEWVVQLKILQHAGEHAGLRTPNTLEGLAEIERLGLLGRADCAALREAWTLAARARRAILLWRGRPSDALPASRIDLAGIAGLLGFESPALFEETYLRTTRRARHVVNTEFFGIEP